MDRIGYVLNVAIAIVAINQHRKITGGHYLAHGFAFFAEMCQVNIRQCKPCAIEGKAANLIGFEACVLDYFCGECVMCSWELQEFLFGEELSPARPDCFATGSHAVSESSSEGSGMLDGGSLVGNESASDLSSIFSRNSALSCSSTGRSSGSR